MTRNHVRELDELRTVLKMNKGKRKKRRHADTPDWKSWNPGSTSVSSLSERGLQLLLGVRLPPGTPIRKLADSPDERVEIVRRATVRSAPRKFDVRNVDGVNYDNEGVRNQGLCAACSAFGTVATMEVVYRYHTTRSPVGINISEAHLFYSHGATDGASWLTGWSPKQAFAHTTTPGVTLEEYYPYVPGHRDRSWLDQNWPDRRAYVTGYRDITGDVAMMKHYISTYGAVTASMHTYIDFLFYRGGVYRHTYGGLVGGLYSGHCVCLIGYNDARGYWIGRNSWGPDWGAHGYFKIAYGQCHIETLQVVGADGVALHNTADAVLDMSLADEAIRPVKIQRTSGTKPKTGRS